MQLSYALPLYATTVSMGTAAQQATGTEFTIEILVDSVTDLYGLASDIVYDTTFLEVVDADATPGNGIQPSVTEGQLLNNNGQDVTYLRSALEDDTPGTLVLGLSRSSNVAGVNASTDTIILSVRFKALQAGTTSISFTKQALKDSAEADITVSAWNGATINILESADISVNPVSKDFGESAVGSQSTAQSFTISNAAGERMDLVIGSLFLAGANASHFAIQSDNCSGQTVIPGASCTVGVFFSPVTAGPKTANLSIPSSDPDTPTLLPLSGIGVSTLTVSIDPASTGSVTGTDINCPTDCTESYNTAGASVELTAAAITGYHFVNWSGAVSGTQNPITLSMDANKSITANFVIDTYTITASAGLNGSISPSGAVTVQHGSDQAFTITPNSGFHVDDVLVDSVSVGAVTTYTFNSVTDDHTISASFAIDIVPNISVIPPSHDFGTLDLGTSSSLQTFTVSNNGNGNLNIGTLSITGANASEFSKQSDNCSGQPVVPSADCTVGAIFSPLSQGSKTANLVIPSDDPDTPSLSIALIGVGGCLKGDANDDGQVNIIDAIAALRIVLLLEQPPGDLCPVDIDGDPGVDITDVIKIILLSL